MAHVRDVEGRNKGSTVIEMTLLIPILLGCFFLYVIFFISFMNNAKGMEQITIQLYEQSIQGKSLKKGDSKKKGNVIVSVFENHDKWFDYRIQIKRNGRDSLKSIRRWQLATGKI